MPDQTTNAKASDQPKKAEPWYERLAPLIAIVFWFYVITQIFVFDLDAFIRSRLPLVGWLIQFKIAFILGVFALIWSFARNTTILLWFLYIALFPLIVLFWYIPRFIWTKRSWNLTFAYINTFLSTAKSLRYGAIIFALIIIEGLLAIETKSVALLWLAVALCSITLIAAFAHRVTLIFRPSALYEVHSKLTGGMMKFGKKVLIVEKTIKELPAETMFDQMTQQQRATWSSNLQMAIILNRGCKFFSRKLEDYQRSKITAVFYILNFLSLMILSILMFSLINFAIYKIDQSNYVLTTKPSLFIFFYYSANTIWGHGISEVAAASNLSRVFFLGELLVTFLLAVILITIWSSVKSEREADEIREAIYEIRKQGDEMASFIKSEYGYTVEDALTCLVTLNLAGMMKVIQFLSQYEDRKELDS